MIVYEVATARRIRNIRAPRLMTTAIEPGCVQILSDKPELAWRWARIVDDLHRSCLADWATRRARTSKAASLDQKSISNVTGILDLSGRITVACREIRRYIERVEAAGRDSSTITEAH